MLTVQSAHINNYNKSASFGNGMYHSGMFDDAEYVDYEEVSDSGSSYKKADYFDIAKEREKAAQELDLWEETKHNLDSIARTTESVPVLNKGMKIFSGLISIAVGWGGLRWGTVGTLEVLNKMGQSTAVKYVRNIGRDIGGSLSTFYNRSRNYLDSTDLVRSLRSSYNAKKLEFNSSDLGIKLSNLKKAIKENSLYTKAVEIKNDTLDYCRKLNPKRIFVESMGIAGGGTAAVNTMGANAIDGNSHDIEQIDNDVFIVDGRYGLNCRRGGSRYAA